MAIMRDIMRGIMRDIMRGVTDGISAGISVIFSAPLIRSLIPSSAVSAAYTFTRTSAATITDFEGLVKDTLAEEARFEGARRVENLAASTSVPATQSITVVSGRVYQVVIGAGSASGATAVLTDAATGTLTGDATDRQSFDTAKTAGSTTLTVTITGAVTNLQVEDVTGQVNQNPSEYVSVGDSADHGTNVDGVKYFATENGNTVTSNVVTEAPGTDIPAADLKGVLIEEARTNFNIGSEDVGVAPWSTVATSLVITSNDTVAPDGNTTANKVENLGAPDIDEVIIFSSGLTNDAFTALSLYIKRISTTGTMRLTNPQSSARGYWRVDMSLLSNAWEYIDANHAAVTIINAWQNTVDGFNGFRFSTVSGSIDFWTWGVQQEEADSPSSYIPTSGAAATRTIDALSYPIPDAEAEGTLYCEWVPDFDKTTYSGFARPLVVMDASTTTGVLGVASGAGHIESTDGSTTISNTYAYSADELVKIAIRWSEADGVYRIASQGAFTAIEAAFNGWDLARWDDAMHLLRDGLAYGTMKNVQMWNGPLTDAELVSLTT